PRALRFSFDYSCPAAPPDSRALARGIRLSCLGLGQSLIRQICHADDPPRLAPSASAGRVRAPGDRAVRDPNRSLTLALPASALAHRVSSSRRTAAAFARKSGYPFASAARANGLA